MATFNSILAKVAIQEYIQAANNIKIKALVAAYQELENYLILIYIAVKAQKVVNKA